MIPRCGAEQWLALVLLDNGTLMKGWPLWVCVCLGLWGGGCASDAALTDGRCTPADACVDALDGSDGLGDQGPADSSQEDTAAEDVPAQQDVVGGDVLGDDADDAVVEDAPEPDAGDDEPDAGDGLPPTEPPGGDYAVFGGLDVTRFEGAEQRLVTTLEDNGPGSLRDVLAWAAQRGQDGLYSVVGVADDIAGGTVILDTELPEVSRTWINGSGLEVLGQAQEPLYHADCGAGCQGPADGFVLDAEVILENLTLGHFDDGIKMKQDATAIWVRHVTLKFCADEQVDAGLTLPDIERHVTFSDNHFMASQQGSTSHALTLQQCSRLDEDDCEDHPAGFFVSMHHNRFDAGFHGRLPLGGVRLLYYNNHIEGSQDGAGMVAMWDEGQVISRHNIFADAQDDGVAFERGTANHQGDWFEGVEPGLESAEVDFASPFGLDLLVERAQVEGRASQAGVR